MRKLWCFGLVVGLLSFGSLACNKEVTRATNVDLEDRRTAPGEATERQATPTRRSESQPASSGTESRPPQQATQEPERSQDTRDESADQETERREPSSASATVSLTPLGSVSEMPEWYRPMFENPAGFVMIWENHVQDPEVEGLDHRDRYLTNCLFERVGPVDGLIALKLSCDNDEDDFFQGYYVAAEQGVWLLDQLPRSIRQLQSLIEDGDVYEIPLLPAEPRASSRAIRDGQRSVVFSMEQNEAGNWCRRFAIPSSDGSREYFYCMNDDGSIELALSERWQNERVMNSTRYERWRGQSR